MILKYLFPHRFKKIGWIILIPTLIAGILGIYLGYEPEFFNTTVFAILNDGFLSEGHNFQFITDNVFNEIIGILLIISSLFVAFSRQKEEDEFIAKIRLESLVWATFANYAVLILAMIFVYGISFFNVMTFNLFTILFFFIFRFNWELMKLRKTQGNEE
jgi:uncharacterized membrane protein YfcA